MWLWYCAPGRESSVPKSVPEQDVPSSIPALLRLKSKNKIINFEKKPIQSMNFLPVCVVGGTRLLCYFSSDLKDLRFTRTSEAIFQSNWTWNLRILRSRISLATCEKPYGRAPTRYPHGGAPPMFDPNLPRISQKLDMKKSLEFQISGIWNRFSMRPKNVEICSWMLHFVFIFSSLLVVSSHRRELV